MKQQACQAVYWNPSISQPETSHYHGNKNYKVQSNTYNNLPKCRGFRVTDGINKGPLVPFSGGRGEVKARSTPENFEISKP